MFLIHRESVASFQYQLVFYYYIIIIFIIILNLYDKKTAFHAKIIGYFWIIFKLKFLTADA